jgi:hypothetical protein
VTFYSALALAVGLLVVAPYLAHRLRRRSAEERPFPPARLVPPAPPKARRRALLEDKALYVTRAAVVVALALLGATPFVRCSRLSLQRAGGASVAMAIVLDDSMSMRADAGGRSRFVRAREGARELLSSAREGDEVAVVLAGAPARVALAATTNLAAARDTVDALVPSDRATDLDGALVLARGLVASLPQLDRRVVVLSDLADGQPDAPPLGEASGVPVWIALPELRARGTDCALMRADQRGARVRIAIACGPGATLGGREVFVEDAAGKTLGHAAPANGPTSEVVVTLSSDDATSATRARLSGADAIAVDDSAPVVSEAGRGAIAVVADSADEAVATGGAPIVEQAFSALKLDLEVHPMPALPDRLEDLAGDVGIVLDDPPGLTPEQRHALGAFVEGGGLALVALGPHAAAAPLGATLEPILAQSVAWREAARVGADPSTAVGVLLGSASGLADLGASWRAVLAPEDAAAFDPIVKWTDGAPLVARRTMGRGETWLVTLPLSADASDLPLRPAFLSLLDGWVKTAREHAAPRRSNVGTVWKFPGARSAQARGPAGPVAETREDGIVRVVAPLVGTYDILVDGKREMRVAAPDVREIDLRPRALAESALGERLGERRAAVDISAEVALALLALMCAEMILRALSKRRAGTAEG